LIDILNIYRANINFPNLQLGILYFSHRFLRRSFVTNVNAISLFPNEKYIVLLSQQISSPDFIRLFYLVSIDIDRFPDGH
jgi:hypothetical protein